MKRMFLFILVIIIAHSSSVLAEEVYYTEYDDFREWTNQEIEEDEFINVENEMRYKWSRTNRNNGEYYIKGENDEQFPFIDEEDFILSEASNWNKEMPQERDYRTIDAKTVYKYNDLDKVRFLYIYDVFGSYGSLRFQEIDVSVNGVYIDYGLNCNGCNMYFINHVNNDIIRENMGYIANETGHAMLDLKNYYSADELLIEIYLYDVEDTVKKFSLALSGSSYFYNDHTLHKDFSKRFEVDDFESYYINVVPDDTFILNDDKYGEDEFSDDEVDENAFRKIESYEVYSYFDELYKYYNEEIEWFDDNYYKESPFEGYVSGEGINFYRYRKRNKIIINDEIKNTDDAIVKFSSFDADVLISDNIDYKTNGVYSVELILPNSEVLNRRIKVDIKENDYEKEINTLKKQIVELEVQTDKSLNATKEAQGKYENIKNEYKKLQNEKNELIDNIISLNNKIDSFEVETKIIKEVCHCEKCPICVECEEKVKQSNVAYYFLFSVPVILLVRFIVRKIKMMKR